MSFRLALVIPRKFGYLIVFCKESSDAAMYESCGVVRGSVPSVHTLEYEITLAECQTPVEVFGGESSLADEQREVFVEA